MARDWANDADYNDVDRLDPSGLAWEFARRNADLRAELSRAAPDLRRWGLAVPADVERTAMQTAVWWRWDFAPGVVVQLAPADLGVERHELVRVATTSAGERLRMPNGLQVVAPLDGARLAVLLPLDSDFHVRGAAARALHVGLSGVWPALPLPSRWRRARVRQLLRAVDGRAAGASYRQLAERVLGDRFEDTLDWRLSPSRGLAIRLVDAGQALVRGGFARLLRLAEG